MKHLLSLMLLLLLVCCHSTTKLNYISEDDFKYTTQLDALVDTFLMDSLMNSLSIGVYHKGETFSKHYGELDPGQNNTPNNNTIYDIASVSKTLVGTLMAQAELEGKLSIEDDVQSYLDGDYSNLQYGNEPIKIKHLLTHSGRLPNKLPLRISDEFNEINADLPNRISKIVSNFSKEEFFEDLKTIQLDTLPGYKYQYSGVGVELACYILEQVYKMPYEQLLKTKLCKALNMPATTLSLSNEQKLVYANGYGDFLNKTPGMETALWGGSGFTKSTLPDLMNYIKYHLNEEDPIVKKSHQILFDQDIIDGDPRIKMGYLWQVSTDRDFGKVIKHHGGAYGVQNWMLIYPEKDLGISIITNQSGWHTNGKLLYVAYGLLDEMAKE